MTDLGALGGACGLSDDLNDAGQVVGSMNLAGDQAHRAFMWGHGTITDLGTLSGATSDAEWENAAGDVVGRANVPNTGAACGAGGALGSNKFPHHAAMWKNGKTSDLGTPPGQARITATGINSRDQMVGSTGGWGHGGDGFLWQNGTMYLASTLVAPRPDGLTVEDTLYVNHRGETYGVEKLPNGDKRAILLEPAHRNTATEGSVSSRDIGATGSSAIASRLLRGPWSREPRCNTLGYSRVNRRSLASSCSLADARSGHEFVPGRKRVT